MKKISIIAPLLSLASIIFSQDLKVTIQKDQNKRIIQFLDERTPSQIPIIVKKTTTLDSQDKPLYEIGLFIIVSSVPLDIMLQKGGVIIFEDNSKFILSDPISTVYLYSGKHQIFLGHQINLVELHEMQNKKIKAIQISGLEAKIDRFSQDFLQNIFKEIELK